MSIGRILALSFGILLMLIAAFNFGIIFGSMAGFKDGYIQSLVDIQNNAQPKYILEKQKNGELRWREVE